MTEVTEARLEQARRERENGAFHEWWKASGHADDPVFTLTMENCAHAAWQERAALSAGQAQPSVKPLEWVVWSDGWQAHTPFGSYTVEPSGAGWLWRYCFDEYYDEESFACDSPDEGKDSAWKHWLERVSPCVLPQPAVPGEVRTQLDLIKHLAEYTTEKNWADKRLYIMQAVDRALSTQAVDVQGETEYRIVFDGFPSPDGPRFIEVENAEGKSINAGEWRKRPDGLCELVITTGGRTDG